MERHDIRAEVITLIERGCGMVFADTECGDNDDLLKAGVLDSMAFLEVLLGIGKVCGVQIVDKDIANPSLSSVEGMCKMVLVKKRSSQ